MKKLFLLLLPGLIAPCWGTPLVVTTIHPLTMIIEAIAGEEVEVRQLLSNTGEPHHYSMRIADKVLLNQADLVIWIGPKLEVFLSRSIADLDPEGVITSSALPDVRMTSKSALNDPHIWLNPHNGIVIATEISNWLVAHFPTTRATIRARLRQFKAQTQARIGQIRAQLVPVKEANMLVDHDAFRHFFDFFGLRQAGALKRTSGLPQGANALHALLSSEEIDCVISEPRSQHGRVANIAAKLSVPLVTIDPLGADLPHLPNKYDNANGYIALLENIAAGLEQCAPKSPR